MGALQRRSRLCGPSGAMSAILPLCDAILEISMGSPELGAMLASFEECARARPARASPSGCPRDRQATAHVTAHVTAQWPPARPP